MLIINFKAQRYLRFQVKIYLLLALVVGSTFSGLSFFVSDSFAQKVIVGTKLFSIIGGTFLYPHQMALYDMQTGQASILVEAQIFENFDAVSFNNDGSLAFSGRTSLTVGGSTLFPKVIGEYNWLTQSSAVQFTASSDIAAIHIVDPHTFLIAFKVATQLGGLDYRVGDIFQYDSQSDTAVLLFSADNFFVAEEGGTYAVGNIDAIAMTALGNLLLSTTNTAEIGSDSQNAVRLEQSGVYEYNLSNGAVTTYFDHGIILGSSVDIKAFAIVPDLPFDNDADGVPDYLDQCQNTSSGAVLIVNGCALSDLDTDSDGVTDDIDICPATPIGEPPNAQGCAWYDLDDDIDGIINGKDFCLESPPSSEVNVIGCPRDSANIALLPLLGYGLLAAGLIIVRRNYAS